MRGVRLTNARVDRWIKPLVHTVLAIPLLWLIAQWALVFQGEPNGLGFNPHQASNRFSGLWALRFLLLALAVGPLSRALGQPKILRLRRLTGLWAFAYAVIHLASYAGLDQLLDLGAIWDDIVKRTYITFGVAALTLLIPLAATSTKAAMRRLGRRWVLLHRLVFPAAVLAVLHFAFLVKGNQREPWLYAGILALLLGYRVAGWARKIRAKRRLTRAAPAV